jgi:hypothetical protein
MARYILAALLFTCLTGIAVNPVYADSYSCYWIGNMYTCYGASWSTTCTQVGDTMICN